MFAGPVLKQIKAKKKEIQQAQEAKQAKAVLDKPMFTVGDHVLTGRDTLKLMNEMFFVCRCKLADLLTTSQISTSTNTVKNKLQDLVSAGYLKAGKRPAPIYKLFRRFNGAADYGDCREYGDKKYIHRSYRLTQKGKEAARSAPVPEPEKPAPATEAAKTASPPKPLPDPVVLEPDSTNYPGS